jgi:hypothetical protein
MWVTVSVKTLDTDLFLSVTKAHEPILVQALVPKLPIEAFDECVLDRLARADVHYFNPAFVRPAIECCSFSSAIPRRAPKTGHLWAPQNRPVLTI